MPDGIFEQQRGATRAQHTIGYFRHFQMGINRRTHTFELASTFQHANETAKIVELRHQIRPAFRVPQQCACYRCNALIQGNTFRDQQWHIRAMSSSLTLAITGASGAQYGLRLLQVLTRHRITVHCLLSEAASVVIRTEVSADFPASANAIPDFFYERFGVNPDYAIFPAAKDWFSCVASGSSAPRSMVICPCSMGTLAAIAHGLSDNLIERAADVVLKERGKLIVVPRETPLSLIHLQNMLTLTQAGAMVLPAAPGFYQQPRTLEDLIDSLVQRILDQLGIAITLAAPWGSAR